MEIALPIIRTDQSFAFTKNQEMDEKNCFMFHELHII